MKHRILTVGSIALSLTGIVASVMAVWYLFVEDDKLMWLAMLGVSALPFVVGLFKKDNRKEASIVLCFVLFAAMVGGAVTYAQPTPPVKDQPPITKTADPLIPLKLTVGAGDPVILDGSKAKGNVKWLWHGNAKSVVIDGKKLTFSSAKEGTYKVGLISWDDQTYDTCTITVGTPVVDPPVTPPVTLDSLSKQISDLAAVVQKNTSDIAALQKVPPPVVDPFQAAVQAAWVTDGKDAASAASLAAIYRQSAPTVANSTKASDVLTTMHAAATSLIGDKLPTVRRVLADEFNAAMGKTDKVLDAPTRALITAEFAKAQKALEGVK